MSPCEKVVSLQVRVLSHPLLTFMSGESRLRRIKFRVIGSIPVLTSKTFIMKTLKIVREADFSEVDVEFPNAMIELADKIAKEYSNWPSIPTEDGEIKILVEDEEVEERYVSSSRRQRERERE